jgi:hypothetical protein
MNAEEEGRRILAALTRVQHARVQEIVAGREAAQRLRDAVLRALKAGATDQDVERALHLIDRAAKGDSTT